MEINGNQGITWNWNGIHIFFGFGIQLMLVKALKYFLDVILGGIQGIEHYQQNANETGKLSEHW
jgi:hypothetical protein